MFFDETFNSGTLAGYCKIAERLFDEFNERVFCYVILPTRVDVTVRECDIPSVADFVIKLAVCNQDPCRMVLDVIKGKVMRNEVLSDEDIGALRSLTMICPDNERDYYLAEYLKIMSII